MQTILGPVQKMLWVLLGAVGIVLLIAMSNVANLLLARATARSHELGIRTALGAERGRIIRQLLTESLLLGCVGGALGTALAMAVVRVLTTLNPGDIPRFDSARIDGHVLLVAVILSISAGVVSGLVPAVSASRANVNDLLRTAGSRIAGTSNGGRSALIVLQAALSVILLAGSGLLIRSYLQLQAVDPGFSPATLTFSLNLDARYNKPELRTAFYKRFLERLQSMPGVKHVGAVNSIPLSRHESLSFAGVRGIGDIKEMVESRSVTRDYRKALGTPLLRGRDFELPDITSKAPVVMVNKSFVDKYFQGRDPLGGQVRMGVDLPKTPWSTVIGVVGGIRHTTLEEASQPQVFELVDTADNFAIQSSSPLREVIDQARSMLRSLDPAVTLENVHTMGERMTEINARRRFQTALLTGFAALAVALCMVGLYGLMSYSVKQRTTEIGVRLALGSSRAEVLSLFLAQGLRLTVLGLVIGLGVAFAITRLIDAWLFGIRPTDPVTFVAVPLILLAVACLACIIPAWSATRIDPVLSLRQE